MTSEKKMFMKKLNKLAFVETHNGSLRKWVLLAVPSKVLKQKSMNKQSTSWQKI